MGGYQTPTHSGASRYSERSPSVEASVEDDSKVYHKRRSPVARSKFGVGNEDDACDGASDAVDSHDAGPTHNANTNVTTSDPEHAHHGHGAPCTGSPGASTPSGTPERFVTPPTHPSQLVTDTCQTVSPESLKRKRETASSAASSNKSPKIEIPRNIREHNKLHQKATSYKPQTTLGPNRYWIGILNPDMPIKQVRKQHDLIWIKGNGGSTVKTIWHTYQSQAGLIDNFELTIQGQTPKPTDVMRELDFHNDRCVIFRAVTTISID